jgi:hypothetical protein
VTMSTQAIPAPRRHVPAWRSLLRRKDVTIAADPAAPVRRGAVSIRLAGPDDEPALARLAALDSRRPPRGAVVAGELWAAVSLDDGHDVADPFRPSGELVLTLHEHGRHVRRAARGSQERVPRVWPRGARPA